MKEAAAVDRALGGRSKHDLLLQSLRQTIWSCPGPGNLNHLSPLSQIVALKVFLQEAAGALRVAKNVQVQPRLTNWSNLTSGAVICNT